ncbi:MAG: T9SS type A sorting domain-containing protein [Candidatus Kapaibacterium sp.]
MKNSVKLITLIIFYLAITFTLNSAQMKFIENNGQWKENIKFISQRNGLVTSVTNSGIYFDFYNKNSNRIFGEVIKLNILNTNNYNFTPSEKLEEKFHYFISNNSENWVRNVNSYGKLTAKNIYDGIDFIYYIDNNNPRYDFKVKPYANIEQIELSFEGDLEINLDNNIIELITPSTIIENSNLFAYQLIDGNKVKVDCDFELIGNKVSFKVGEYDKSKELIIDPLIYSSYYGSSGDDTPKRVKFIDEKNILLVGSTTSTDFKTTPGSYDEEYADRTDAFVTKIKVVNGQYIPVFTTLLGSLEFDEAIDFAITNEYLLITGVTESPDFPILKPISSKYGGGKEIFITSLSLDGSELLKSSYYGGNGDDEVVEVYRDRNNYFLFAAHTTSNNIQTIAGPPNSNYKGGKDILMFTILPSREAANMSAHIGGFLDDVPTDMFIDPSNEDIYLTGWTTSSKGTATNDFPTYPLKRFGVGGPYDETSNGGKDAFEMVLTKNAQSFIISGFLGGDGDDIGRGIYKDENENIYVMGETYNNTKGVPFPVSTGSSNVLGNSDLFITKYNKLEELFGTKTQTRSFSILIQSQGDEVMSQMIKHPALNSFASVTTSNGRFPEIDLSQLKAKNNIIYSEIEMSSGVVNNAKVYGGNDDDVAVSFDFDKYNNYLIAGYSESSDFPITINAYQKQRSSGKDIVLIRNAIGNITYLNPPTNISLCVGSEVIISWSADGINSSEGYSLGYSYDDKHDIFNEIASNVKEEFYKWVVPQELSGKKNVRIRVTHNSGLFSENIDNYEVNERATLTDFQLISSDTVCIGDEIRLKANAVGVDIEYTWLKNNKEIGKTTTNEFTISNVKTEDSGIYKVSIENDCPPADESKNSFNIYVSPNTTAGSIPEEITKNKGETMEITTNANGVGLKYIWQKDGNNLPAQNKKTLTLSNLSLNDAGQYRCLIEGKCGIDSTNETTVIINDVIGSVTNSLNEIAKFYETSKNIYRIEFLNLSEYKLELYDNAGNLLINTTYNSNTVLDLNHYSSGVYWINIIKGNKTFSEKVIKIN